MSELNKFPKNNFQITINKCIGEQRSEDVLSGKISTDLQNFQIKSDNKTLSGLTNIEIPDDVNPLNHISLFRKIKVEFYINQSNKVSDVELKSPIQFLVSLNYKNNSNIVKLANDENYLTYYVTLYKQISTNVKTLENIKELIIKDLNITEDKINENTFVNQILFDVNNDSIPEEKLIKLKNECLEKIQTLI